MIQSIELKHTNPSMGPHERIISYSLTNTDAHKAEFDQLSNGTKVNEEFDLKTLLIASKNKDSARIEKIFKADYKGPLNVGETISILNITLVGGLKVCISDLRTTQLSGYYPEFIRYLVGNGARYESSSNKMPIFLEEEEGKVILQKTKNIRDRDSSI